MMGITGIRDYEPLCFQPIFYDACCCYLDIFVCICLFFCILIWFYGLFGLSFSCIIMTHDYLTIILLQQSKVIGVIHTHFVQLMCVCLLRQCILCDECAYRRPQRDDTPVWSLRRHHLRRNVILTRCSETVRVWITTSRHPPPPPPPSRNSLRAWVEMAAHLKHTLNNWTGSGIMRCAWEPSEGKHCQGGF